MAVDHANSPLGRAWAFHRDGRNDAARTEFERILQAAPDDMDANFGYGLVLRAMGKYEDAIAAFEKVKTLLVPALAQEPSHDRLQMLSRMTDQRIAEVRSVPKK